MEKTFNPHRSEYLEIYDEQLRSHIETMLNPDLLAQHSLSQIVKLGGGKWLLIVAPDYMKQSKIEKGGA